MHSMPVSVLLAPALLLGGCAASGSADSERPAAASTSGRPAEPASDAGAAQEPPVADSVGEAQDPQVDLTPPPLTPEAGRSITGARNILLSFARAIELEEFDQAWAVLSEADQRRWSKAQFAALFSDLSGTTVAIAQGTTEGAAGSIYYTAPITITAEDESGRPVRMEGEAVLRRVNDVDGATAAQLRWHFGTLTLDWTH